MAGHPRAKFSKIGVPDFREKSVRRFLRHRYEHIFQIFYRTTVLHWKLGDEKRTMHPGYDLTFQTSAPVSFKLKEFWFAEYAPDCVELYAEITATYQGIPLELDWKPLGEIYSDEAFETLTRSWQSYAKSLPDPADPWSDPLKFWYIKGVKFNPQGYLPRTARLGLPARHNCHTFDNNMAVFNEHEVVSYQPQKNMRWHPHSLAFVPWTVRKGRPRAVYQRLAAFVGQPGQPNALENAQVAATAAGVTEPMIEGDKKAVELGMKLLPGIPR